MQFATGSAEVHHCLFTKWSDYTCVKHDFYEISTIPFLMKSGTTSLVMITAGLGREDIVVSVQMAMDLLCFPMAPLALIALSMDIFGYYDTQSCI